jgi:(2Fe-2S) ferredoxin
VGKLKDIRAHVLVCAHDSCEDDGAKAAAKELKRALKERGLRDRVLVTKVDCLDQCGDGPVMVVYPEGVWYGRVGPADARGIADGLAPGGRASCGARVLHDLRGGGGGG